MRRPALFICAASASVLPPAPAHQSITVWPGRAPHRAAAIWLASSCTSIQPVWKGAGGLHVGGAGGRQAQAVAGKGRGLGLQPVDGQQATRRFHIAAQAVHTQIDRSALAGQSLSLRQPIFAELRF